MNCCREVLEEGARWLIASAPSTGWYDDQREVHGEILRGNEGFDHGFIGTNPNSADNRWLRDAMQQ
jgi:hypothetical protein